MHVVPDALSHVEGKKAHPKREKLGNRPATALDLGQARVAASRPRHRKGNRLRRLLLLQGICRSTLRDSHAITQLEID